MTEAPANSRTPRSNQQSGTDGSFTDPILAQRAEISAIEAVTEALVALEQPAQRRVIDYITSLFDLSRSPGGGQRGVAAAETPAPEPSDVPVSSESSFSDCAHLFDALQPESNEDKALAAAYWLQLHGENGEFTTREITRELTHLGENFTHMSRVLERLRSKKPALIRQVRATGKGRGFRRTYAITEAGRKLVQQRYQGTGLGRATVSAQEGDGSATRETEALAGHRPQPATTKTIATRMGAKKAPDLVRAASARLVIVDGRETFSRQELLEEMKTATGHYKPSVSNNLTVTVKRLMEKSVLNETAPGTYTLTPGAERQMRKFLGDAQLL